MGCWRLQKATSHMLSGVLSLPHPQPSGLPLVLGYEYTIAQSYGGCTRHIFTVTLPAIWGAIGLKLGGLCISKAPCLQRNWSCTQF